MLPQPLYRVAVVAYVGSLNHNVANLDRLGELRLLPVGLLSDVLMEMSAYESLVDILGVQFTDLDIFLSLLRHSPARCIMFECMKVLTKNPRLQVVRELRLKFFHLCCDYLHNECVPSLAGASMESVLFPGGSDRDRPEISPDVAAFAGRYVQHIHLGLEFGTFMTEAGWPEPAADVLELILPMIKQLPNCPSRYMLQLNCLQKLLVAQTKFCLFKKTTHTLQELQNTIELMQKMEETMGGKLQSPVASDGDLPRTWKVLPPTLLACAYQQISQLHFYTSEYEICYYYGILALNYIDNGTPAKVIVDVLRQAAKACILKRKFDVAGILIKKAVRTARDVFGTQHQKYADALLDYGYYLLNVDSILNSATVNANALDIYRSVHGKRNLYVGIAHEDLAYSLYVKGYNSGTFENATNSIDSAIDIMQHLVPPNHLTLASAKRVKALIVEEVALDTARNAGEPVSSRMLQQAEDLHQAALQLALEMFGSDNVQTAKHYGNLGRLYQSMQRYKDSERMHKIAIEIKCSILGPYDHEVGLSIGHLASLYNYHMHRQHEAEKLYLKSIAINLRLFGPTYSGLEYDYTGLIRAYSAMGNEERVHHYMDVLHEWGTMRGEYDAEQIDPYDDVLRKDVPLAEVRQKGLALAPTHVTSSSYFVDRLESDTTAMDQLYQLLHPPVRLIALHEPEPEP